MIQINKFTFNPFQENTYVIWDFAGNGVIIDPGCYTFEERKELKDFISEHQISLKSILNTHAHIDHVLGIDFIKNEYQIPLYLHPEEVPIFNDSKKRADVYGFPHYQAASVDFWFHNDEIIEVGEMRLKVLFVPGHAPGHVAFYEVNEGFVIGGDVLFRRSIGRTDFPLCNHADLIQSIQTQLYTLPKEVIVYPGHGGPTSIGEEMNSNPFVNAL